MAKQIVSEELRILRFFKEGPIEKVEVVFTIVADQMRERLRGQGGETRGPAKEAGATPRRKPSPANTAPAEPVPPEGSVG